MTPKRIAQLAALAVILLSMQGQAAIRVSPFAVITSYSKSLNLTPVFGFGASLSYELSRESELHISFDLTNSNQKFDVVSSSASLDVQVIHIIAQYNYQFATVFSIVNFSLVGGVGFMRLTSSEYQVSIGALGFRTVPSQQNDHGLVLAGFEIQVPMGQNVSVFVEPSIRAFPLESQVRSNFSIVGGIGVSIP